MTVRARLLIALTMACILGIPTAASAQQPVAVIDVEAGDAVDRSIVNSQLTFDSSDTALIGRDDVFADNLASGVLQGTGDQPLLLTGTNGLDADVLTELERLGVTSVTLLGGEVALSSQVEADLGAEGIAVDRLAGQTRVETAIAIAEQVTSETVLIARAFANNDPTQAFADSLAAGAWAAATGWPVVFTQTEALTGSTRDHLQVTGYLNAFVIGGPAAISDEVFNAIDAIVGDVQRVAGDSRFETAVAIANQRGFSDSSDADVTIVVDGQADDAWTDGFTLAALAGRLDAPIVLANSADITLPAATTDFLVPVAAAFAQSDPAPIANNVRAICADTVPDGGASDQCDQVMDEIGATERIVFEGTEGDGQFGVSVTPTSVQAQGTITINLVGLTGPTAVSISGCGISQNTTLNNSQIGENGAASVSVTLPQSQPVGSCSLSVRVTDEEGTELYDQATTITVTAPTTAGATGSARPELASATIVQTVAPAAATAQRPQGTYVRYTFDSAVATQTVASFFVYTAEHVRYTAETAVIESGALTVEARFDATGGPTLSDTGNASLLTLAAVAESAVVDTMGRGNPASSVGIGTSRTTNSGGVGQTEAPDLTTVSGFRAGALTTQTAVDFTFDEIAYVTSNVGAGFSLVMTDGTEVACFAPLSTTPVSGGSAAGGSGEVRITVDCPATSTAANTARGIVAKHAVSDAQANEFQNCAPACSGRGNPLSAAAVAASGNTPNPDLTFVTFDPNSVAGVDRVAYTFDQAVLPASVVAGDGPLFKVYTVTGSEIAGQAVAPTVSGTQVIVTFADGALATAVGANVEGNVVQANDAPNGANRADEEAVGNVTTVITPGQTTGPQLVSTALERPAQNFPPNGVLYTFDEAVANVTAAQFKLFLTDGTMLTGSTCALVAAPNNHQVRCTAYGAATGDQIGAAIIATVSHTAVTDAAGVQNSAPGAVRIT